MATATIAREPKVAGRYDLEEKIGSGGMGSVYRARDRETGQVVAVKLLTTQVSSNDKRFRRFSQEFQASSKLEHPNVVRALDFGMEGPRAYLAMEYVEGTSLGAMIEAAGRLPEDAAVRIVTQIAQALHFAHSRRIIHRDVKPDNILVRADGLAKLGDFGLAKDFDDDNDLTKAASGLGTPHFMAPEQYEDAKNATSLSDVYSLGATLHCAVTGQLPFEACATLLALAMKAKGDIPSPRELVPEVSVALDEAVQLAMSPDPLRRPANCLDFVRLLAGDRRPTRRRQGALDTIRTPAPQKVSGRDRREAVRHEFRVGTTCVMDTGAVSESLEDWPTRVVDLSRTGMGLVLARRFEPGTRFAVEVQADEHRPAAMLRVRVVRVHPESHGHWFHGCQFIDPLPLAEMRTLLG